MSIETPMKTDRAARLVANALSELELAADDLASVRPSDANHDEAADIAAAIRDTFGLLMVCRQSAFDLNQSVQKR